MKLNLMREFVRLAANRNFSRTAEELYMAQSVLSRHVALLEQELRVNLIDRTTNSFQLTEAGKIVLEEFSAILQHYELLLEKLSHLGEDVAGELRLGVLYYDINFYVSKICEVFRHKYPRMKLTLLSYQPGSWKRIFSTERSAWLYSMARRTAVAGISNPFRF